jgi:hypothetical protein
MYLCERRERERRERERERERGREGGGERERYLSRSCASICTSFLVVSEVRESS